MRVQSIVRRLLRLLALSLSLNASAQAPEQPPDLPWEKLWIPAKDLGFGQTVIDIKLEANIVKPDGNGPFPLVIFSHGSTGPGAIPEKRTLRSPIVAGVFLKHGFAFLAPMRRGRGESGGWYNESYDCNGGAGASGMQYAIHDTDQVFEFVRGLPYIDSSRIILSGISRGGILSVQYAAQRPGVARGVVNFVGGWQGDRCSGMSGGFNESVFKDAGRATANTKIPMLFLYASNDSYYAASSIGNFASLFETAGGNVMLKLYGSVGRNGHALAQYREVWEKDLGGFLEKLGFPKR